MAHTRPFINNDYNYYCHNHFYTSKKSHLGRNHFLNRCFLFLRKGEWNPFISHPLITQLSRLPGNENVSFFNVLWTWAYSIGGRFNTPALAGAAELQELHPTCETLGLWAVFSLSELGFPAAFLSKLHPEKHRPL